MSQSQYGLHRLSNAELTRLLRALHRGALASPISRSSLIEKAFGHVEVHLDLLVGRDHGCAKALIIAVLAERSADVASAGARHGASSLFYLGPPSAGTRSRDTLEQVRELLAGATRSAHLFGLRLDDDRGLLRTVGALIAGRDAHVRLVFDGHELAQPGESVRAFVEQRLPDHGGEKLELFVCTGARLRARALVIDGERVLVTSGELTAREEDGFVDLGVQLHDSALAAAIEDEWTKLLALGAVLPVSAASAT